MNTQRTLPRRRLLAGALTIPAVVIAAALPTAAATENSDAALLELGRQHQAALSLYEALSDQAADAEDAAIAHYPPAPEALYHRPGRDPIWYDHRPDFGQPADAWAVEQWQDNLSCVHRVTSADQITRIHDRAREIIAAWEAWTEAKEHVKQSFGVQALDQKTEAAGIALTELEHQIFATKAQTPAGVKLKARLAKRIVGDEDDGTHEGRVMRSVLSDLIEEDRTKA